MGGIPAFTVGLLGFVLFVAVLSERSRSIWPSVLARQASRRRTLRRPQSTSACGG
jgi:hypothetical protein